MGQDGDVGEAGRSWWVMGTTAQPPDQVSLPTGSV